ncbi:MAG: sporulation protein, partial [Pseudomonadota bacterium]|nr:sporulation protein [Pseudomonadota bacterium]
MAARRGKTQARRNPGNGGLPGWAWGVIGILVGIVLILTVPRFMGGDGDGFFRPQPNPDATPAPVAEGRDALVPEPAQAGGRTRAVPATGEDSDASGGAEYDFYTLLPGKEVPVSDAELAATQRAEADRRARLEAAQAAEAANPDAA